MATTGRSDAKDSPLEPMETLRTSQFIAAVFIAVLGFASPALAHHPGTNLDKVMGDKEKFFQAVDKPAPGFGLADAAGNSVSLTDFEDKVVILNFAYAGCLDVCPLHSQKIAEIQRLLDETPMKTQVQFITVTTDPDRDTAEVLEGYGETHGLDPANWIFLTRKPGVPADATRVLARSYGLEFTETEDGQQMHGVVTHVIDRDGRLAARFHGLRFEAVNMVLYVNGIINNADVPEPTAGKSWWKRLTNWF
ncbi:SCO family protein [Roseibium salinum]|uniref:SCO family protein n=1 Tax=Roseibium salinum TaxID=1604349 RepID=A0ABT3QVN1_9HYPH|nr:SCO family protein [Roseibium sp. DSM 29163]MCX2720981.1 SCO family protein [Roseibium sp. DSM 29163]